MNYFEYHARQGRPAEVALDVIEFEPAPAIEVTERRFDSSAALWRHVANLIANERNAT